MVIWNFWREKSVVRGDDGSGIREGDNVCKMKVWELETGDSISINIVM